MSINRALVHFFYISLFLLVGCGEKLSPTPNGTRPGFSVVAPTTDLWKNGETISVAFLNGKEEDINIVIDAFNSWEQFTNIHFAIIKSPTEKNIKAAFIKVIFSEEKNAGTHSVVGKGCKNYVGTNKPTMQFQFKDTFKSKLGKRKAALHEIGHALGLLHEHTNTNFPFIFKKEFIDTLTPQEKQNYIPKKGQQNNIYDEQSIMLYSFDENTIEFTDKTNLATPSTQIGHFLSYHDVETINQIYPGKFTNQEDLKKEYQKYKEKNLSLIESEKKLNYCQIYSPDEKSNDTVISSQYFSLLHRTKDLANLQNTPYINIYNGEIIYSTTKIEWALEEMETSEKCAISDINEYRNYINKENTRRSENNKFEKCEIKFDSSDDLTYKNLFCIYDIVNQAPIEALSCYYNFNDAYVTMSNNSKCKEKQEASELDN